MSFGKPVANTPTLPMLDETHFGLPAATPPPSPIVTYTVPHPRAIVRAESLAHPLVVDGDASGLVAAAGVGLLADDPTIFYAGTLDQHPSLAAGDLKGPADLVVTDSNRKQAFEWNSLNDNTGYTETASEGSSPFIQNDPALNLFVGTPADAQTTTILGGVASVTASAYGTADTLRPEWRPANALDGNLQTAWQTEGNSGNPLHNWWQVTLTAPTTKNAVNLVQPLPVANEADYTNQWITRATLTFDGKDPVTVDLGPTSRTAQGQTIIFPTRTFRTMRITIDATNLSTESYSPPGSSLTGLAEVRIGNVKATQATLMPDDLLRMVGPSAAADRLTYIMTRLRVAPVPPRADPEVAMIRQFSVPSDRSFAVTGTARISTQVDDQEVDQLVGQDLATAGVVQATSSSRMPGDLQDTASATLDGDPSTAWSPGLGAEAQVGSWLDYQLARPTTLDHLELGVVSDAEHSRPTVVTVSSSSGSATVNLPPIPTTAAAGSVTTVPITFPPITGADFRLTFDQVDLTYSPSYETSLQTALPIAISAVGIPGAAATTAPAAIPSTCRSDLVRLDGAPLWVSVAGSASTALSGGGLPLTLCGPDAQGVRLTSGEHTLTAADGASTGLNIDQLVFDSAPGGAPVSGDTPGSVGATPVSSSHLPVVTVQRHTSTAMTVHVSHASTPFALVLGESVNKGWTASVVGGPNLGKPVLIDGFANGWNVNPKVVAAAGASASFDVVLHFAPQTGVNVALLVSGATALACLTIAVTGWLTRRRRRVATPGAVGEDAGGSIVIDVPFTGTGDAPSTRWSRVVLGTVVAGACAFAFGGPFAGIVVTIGVALAMTWRRGRALLLVSGALLMGAGALDVMVHQMRYRYPPGGWPTHFDRASTLVWGAVLLLGADAALEAVRRFRDRDRGSGRREPPQ